MRREIRRGEPEWRILQFVGLAVLVHLAMVPAVEALLPVPTPFEGPRRRVRLVALRPRNAQVKMPKVRNQPKPEVKREEEPEPKKDDPTGQVVDLPPSQDDEAPEDAKYLSEHNTRTERETRSRHQRQDYATAMNELTRAQQSKTAAKNSARSPMALEIGPRQPNKAAKKREATGNERAFEVPQIKQRDRLALQMDEKLGRVRNQEPSDALLGNNRRLKLSLGDEESMPTEAARAPKQGPSFADLLPTVGVLARISGAPANDFLEDVEEGEGTFLNSREFKFASFFNRVKRGVSRHWHPIDEYRRRDPTGNIYGYRSRITVLDVTLFPDGSLKEISVSRSSGLDFLDREAVSAFRRAQPFPNPPRRMVSDGGLISFPFGFHVDLSANGGLRLPF